MTESERAQQPSPSRIANRYEVIDRLGRGGMAVVYRVRDVQNGRELALKQLRAHDGSERAIKALSLFEREYHTLAQLAHPRVIAVYDYGLDPEGPYYTMELLDGGDLLDRAPLPWREACTLLFDVCSSLALLHSRRLLHRDISPRNVRCTQQGQAKLIDFGAMAPMGGGGGAIVGTPAFCPPEILQRSALDARADLFSLGATLYYALTGRMAYPARSFAEALDAWGKQPSPPSVRDPRIPPALDELVLGLLSLEPGLRPRSAFEVMQRLSAIADIECIEPEGVSRAYLTAPVLVGRDDALETLRVRLKRALRGRGGGLLIRAEAGLGRSRVLDACALEAKTLGVTVLRASVSGAGQPFALALALAQHALEALPSDSLPAQFPQLFERTPGIEAPPRSAGAMPLEAPPRSAGAMPPQDGAEARPRVRSDAELRADPERLQQTIVNFLLSVSRTHPLLIAVDDVQRIDEPSAAVLTSLAYKARRRSVLVALTADDSATRVLDVLARRCDPLALAPLSGEQTELLFGSVFGEVANLHMLAIEVHAVARGNPRTAMDVAQHLVDRGVIAYHAGTWTLPSKLSASDLPRSAEDAIRARVDRLAPLPRFLAQAHALAFHDQLSHDDLRALRPELDPRAVDDAVAELLAIHALASDGESYALSNRLWGQALRASVSAGEQPALHGALAAMFERYSPTAVVHHRFEAGQDEAGLDALLARHAAYDQAFDSNDAIAMNATSMGPSYLRAIATALRLGRSARELYELRRWLTAMSVVSEDKYYWLEGPAWLEQLKHDSGLAAWLADADAHADVKDPGERLMRALTAANARYLETPEHDRVYPVDEAIRLLALYVALSIAIGVRTLDVPLLVSLPALLEPFVPLSPVLEAIWQNARATIEGTRDGAWESARARWLAVHQKLGEVGTAELQHVEEIRNAVAYAIGMTELSMGMSSAATWAARLDGDASQRVSAVYLRKVVRLEQGDWVGAERLQRQAEVFELQARTPQMFDSLLYRELWVYTHARDLGGMKDVTARIDACAGRSQSWRDVLLLAQGRFELARGDLDAARRMLELCCAQTESGARDGSGVLVTFVEAGASLAETLLLLGCTEQAQRCASTHLALCSERGLDSQAHDLVRMLALADARLGQLPDAVARIDALIARQEVSGVSGLKLGLSYEARAQLALQAEDRVVFERFARLTAREYRHGVRCPLSARYERLANEGRRLGWTAESGTVEVASSTMMSQARTDLHDLGRSVQLALVGASDPRERGLRALRMVCDVRAAHVAHLYLVANDALTHVSTFGASDPPESLARLAHEHLTREQNRADTETIVASTALSEGLSQVVPLLHVAGELYELMPLTCVLAGEGTAVGMIALALSAGVAPTRYANQPQLLAAIARQFVQPARATG